MGGDMREIKYRMKYPVRCKIIDVTGVEVLPGMEGRTPDVSKPHVGKKGTAYNSREGVTIKLDDGSILHGHECWWTPLEEESQ
jgi:hypothetical protein